MNTFEAIHGGENHRLWIGGHRGHASATRENTTANFAEVLGMGVCLLYTSPSPRDLG